MEAMSPSPLRDGRRVPSFPMAGQIRGDRTSGERTLRFRGGWARVGAWRGRSDVAHLVLGTQVPVSEEAVHDCLARLRSAGYAAVVTSALAPADSLPFVDAGFDVRERLHLLEHDLRAVPRLDPAAPPLRRAWRSDRPAVLTLDARAFDLEWRLEPPGLRDALRATPAVRFRIGAGHDSVAAYAITGRAGRQGYLQRIAVDPSARRRGWGRTLVLDALRWLRRRDTRRALVNTQLDNDAALALYLSCGFRRLPLGLCVLGRSL
jgi:ribosomal protein S18 acetylase RimI-like enzyme